MADVRQKTLLFILLSMLVFARTNTFAAEDEHLLYVGWASVDITPEKSVNLVGQMTKRISQSVLDPLTATALALELWESEFFSWLLSSHRAFWYNEPAMNIILRK